MFAAFDTGSRFTGFCVGDGHGLPRCGAWAFTHTGDDLGAMLRQLDRHMTNLFMAYPVTHAVFEAPILNPRRDKLSTIRKLYSLAGHVEFACLEAGVEYAEVSLQSVKKELAGFAHADKSDMTAAAEKIGITLPAKRSDGREDAADAFGAWLLLLRARDKKLSARFDAALYGSRGALI